jgi:hypothetical protein
MHVFTDFGTNLQLHGSHPKPQEHDHRLEGSVRFQFP